MSENNNMQIENHESETAEVSSQDIVVSETLEPEQEISGLKKVHQYLSEFDRVPGSMAATWSQMLDTIAVVANSLIAKFGASKSQDDVESESQQ